MKPDKLKILRKKIDAMDSLIVDMLVCRAGYAEAIGLTKEAEGKPVKDAAREERVIRSVRARARRPLAKDSVEHIYKVILRECRGIQKKRKVR